MKSAQSLLDASEIQLREASSGPITSSRIWPEVGDVMSTDVTTVSSDETIVSAVKTMAENKISCIVVVDDSRIVGILTETDILKRIAGRDSDLEKRSVVEVMSSPVETVSRDLSVLDAAEISEKKHIKRLPVLDDQRLVGIVTQTDLVRTMTSCGVWKDVVDIMSRDVAGVQTTATVAEAAQLMTFRKVSCVIALEGDEVVGILTERDLLDKVVAQHRDPTRTTMGEVMSFPVATVPPIYSVFSASRSMEAKGIRRLVVTEGKRLCGIVAQTDIFRAAKGKLQEAEDKHHRMLKESRNSIYTADLGGKTTYVNAAFCELFELSDPEELIGQSFLPERFWSDPEDRLRVLQELRQGSVDIEDLSLKTSKGRHIYVTLFSTSTRNARGATTGTQGVLYDVTEKKELVALREAEEALQESENRYRSLVETTSDWVWETDTSGVFTYVSPQVTTVLGYTAEEVLGKTPFELMPPEESQRVREFFQDMVASRQSASMYESTHVHADGRHVTIESNATPILDSAHNLLGYRGINRDITERKQAERKLRTLHSAVEQSSSTIVITDTAGKIEYANPQFEVTTGYALAEAYGENPRVLKSGQQPAEFYEELWETISSGEVWRGEFLNKRKDGSLYWEAACISPVFDAQGTITQFVAVKDDVTERKRVEEQLRTVSEQDPLTGILNRRAFYDRFDQEWERAVRHGHPLACVMIDLDFFKRINDEHGHAAGDAVIQSVAQLLRDRGRTSDVVCRYGGEEFCVLLPETDDAGAARWAERVRLAVSGIPILAGDLSLHVTASLGVAERLADTTNPEQLVEWADQALAVAKQMGRNRVARFSSLDEPMLAPRDEQGDGPFHGVSARDVMSVALVCPDEDATVQYVTDLFLQLRINSAPVVDEAGMVTGIVTEADLMTRTALGEGWEDQMRDVMRSDVVCYEEDTPIEQVYEFLSRVSVSRVIVVNEGRPSGVISRSTLLRWFRNWVATHGKDNSENRARPVGEREHRKAGIIKTTEAAAQRAVDLRRRIMEEDGDFVPSVVGEATKLQSLVNDLLGYCRSGGVV